MLKVPDILFFPETSTFVLNWDIREGHWTTRQFFISPLQSKSSPKLLFDCCYRSFSLFSRLSQNTWKFRREQNCRPRVVVHWAMNFHVKASEDCYSTRCSKRLSCSTPWWFHQHTRRKARFSPAQRCRQLRHAWSLHVPSFFQTAAPEAFKMWQPPHVIWIGVIQKMKTNHGPNNNNRQNGQSGSGCWILIDPSGISERSCDVMTRLGVDRHWNEGGTGSCFSVKTTPSLGRTLAQRRSWATPHCRLGPYQSLTIGFQSRGLQVVLQCVQTLQAASLGLGNCRSRTHLMRLPSSIDRFCFP